MNADGTETDRQHTLLTAALGIPGSGMARYAAAMYFYNQKLISAEMLEIYRRCSKDDREDPIDLARFEGVASIPAADLLPKQAGQT